MGQLQPSDQKELAQDLQAAVAARRELGPEFEDPLVEHFIARLDQHIEERINAAIAASGGGPPARHQGPDVGFFGAVFALTIPIIAIGGGIAGGPGVIAIAGALVCVSLLYFIDRWIRFNKQ